MITAERAKQLLSYDPATGEFRWLPRDREEFASDNSYRGFHTSRSGRLAGHRRQHSPYVILWLDGRLYYAHRVAWLIVHGEWPRAVVDHIDGDTLNNRIANLRAVSAQDNSHNLRPRRSNKSGVIGVHRHADGKKWAAQIKVDGRTVHLGLFDTVAAAAHARAAASRLHGYHPNHGKAALAGDRHEATG